MPSVKQSGIEWIGAIPDEWQCEELRYLVRLDSQQTSYSSAVPYLALENIESWTGGIVPTDTEVSDEATVNAYKAGDVLFGKLRPYLAKVVKTDTAGTSSSELLAFTPRALCRDYLFYALLCKGFIDAVDVQTYGVKMPRTSWEQLRLMKLPVPPIGEQQRIAETLDEETNRIDKLANAIARQLDVLADYRKSLIQEVVTHGLDPDAEMRPSGIDWIGDIPVHWQSKPFKYVARVSANLVNPEDYLELPEIDPENIEKDTGRLLNVKTVGEVGPISDKQLFRKGQVLYSKIRPLLNKVVIAPCDGLCSADMYPIESGNDIRWLAYTMRSDLFVSQTELVSDRVKMPRVNVEQLGYFVIPVPPLEEQQAIADYLDAKIAAIDRIATAKRAQLDNLRQQRQTIIYEYVTGKRRVV